MRPCPGRVERGKLGGVFIRRPHARAAMIKPRLQPLCALPLALLLAGCMQDSASYPLAGDNHAISLVRYQNWPWQRTVDLDVVAIRLPDCNGGLRVREVPRDAELALYEPPAEYAEPILILRVQQRHFAVSTTSCRVQEFKEPPADPGRLLGRFRERDGHLGFLPESA